MDPVSAVDEVVDPIAEGLRTISTLWSSCSACFNKCHQRSVLALSKFAIETIEISLAGDVLYILACPLLSILLLFICDSPPPILNLLASEGF